MLPSLMVCSMMLESELKLLLLKLLLQCRLTYNLLLQCRSECEKHADIWQQCIDEVGTNAEAKEALNTARHGTVCYLERFCFSLPLTH